MDSNHDGAPYRDARMLLTDAIEFRAHVARRRGSTRPEDARYVIKVVGNDYPALAEKLGEPERAEKIRSAIEHWAKHPTRTPWSLIVPVWNGIEAQVSRNSDEWRQTWIKHKKRRGGTH